MNPKKSNLLFLGSVVFLMMAVGFMGLLSLTTQGNSDIRTRASVANTLSLSGTVNDINEAENTIIVDNVKFTESSDASQSLGQWHVTPPQNFSLSSAFPGAQLTIKVAPASMLAETKTMTATDITVKR